MSDDAMANCVVHCALNAKWPRSFTCGGDDVSDVFEFHCACVCVFINKQAEGDEIYGNRANSSFECSEWLIKPIMEGTSILE